MKRLCAMLSLMALVFTLASCSRGSKTEVEIQVGYDSAQKYAGRVVIEGSRLASPLMESLIKEYTANEQPDVEIELRHSGDTAGIEAFIAQETDLLITTAQTSTEEDKRFVAAFGDGQVYQYRVATDAVVFIINKENTWARELTKNEICSLFVSGSYKSDDKVLWSDVRADWPQEEISIYGPDSTEGLYKHFQTLILQNKDIVKSLLQLDDYDRIVDAVAQDKNAIALVGISTGLRNSDKVDMATIDFGRGPVEPSRENILGSGHILGLYAEFSYPVYLFMSAANVRENPQVLDFVKYILSDEGAQRTAEPASFIPLGEEDYLGQFRTLQIAFSAK